MAMLETAEESMAAPDALHASSSGEATSPTASVRKTSAAITAQEAIIYKYTGLPAPTSLSHHRHCGSPACG